MVRVVKTSNIAKRVRGLMRKSGTRQRELADEIGISEQLLSSKMCGRSNFTLRDVAGIARFFEITTDELIGSEGA